MYMSKRKGNVNYDKKSGNGKCTSKTRGEKEMEKGNSVVGGYQRENEEGIEKN